MTDPSNKADAANVGLIWGAVFLGKLGIHQWSDAAAMFAAVYSLLLIGKFLWAAYKGRNRK